MEGRVTVVQERYLGSTLAVDVSAGASTLTVEDALDFDEVGELIIDPQVNGEVFDYTISNEDSGVVALSGALANSYTADEETAVILYPLSVERYAIVQENDAPFDDEGVQVRVPHTLYDKIPVGVRDEQLGEGETITFGFEGDELIVNDVLARAPFTDGSYIDPGTLPTGGTDGLAPDSSPDAVASGRVLAVAVSWDAVANDDPIVYDVYLSDVSGFTPDGSTLIATTGGTYLLIASDGAGTALDAGTTYYVKIIARDADGSAPEGAQDGAMVLPEAGGTDGSPPASSPAVDTVAGGVGILVARWTAVANADPVAYEVHVSTVSGFTPDSTTLYGKYIATSAVIRSLPDQTPLVIDTDYFIRLIAFDDDGPAAVGVQGSGQIAQVEGGGGAADILARSIIATDIAVGTITADEIGAHQITADLLESTMVLTNTLYVPTNLSGTQRVEIGAGGITLFGADDGVKVSIPTVGDSVFTGQVTTGSLTVTGGMIVQGADNYMDKGSALTLNAQLGNATNAPSVDYQYDTDPLVGMDPVHIKTNGLAYNAVPSSTGNPAYLTVQCGGLRGYVLYEIDVASNTVNRSRTLFSQSAVKYVAGVALMSNYIFVAFCNNSDHIVIRSFLEGDFGASGPVASTDHSATITNGLDRGGAFGADSGTHILFACWGSNTAGAVKKVYRFTQASGVTTFTDSFNLTGGFARQANASYLGPSFGQWGGITGKDGTNYATTLLEGRSAGKNDQTWVELFDQTSHALISSDGNTWHPNAIAVTGNTGHPSAGITYSGSQYHAMCYETPLIYNFSDFVWASPSVANDTFWIGYTWYDGTGTGQTVSSISNASPAVVTTAAAHGFAAGDEVSFASAGGSLGTGINSGTHYYVLSTSLTSTTFRFSLTRGGSAINTTGATTGVVTVTKYHETQMSLPASIQLDGAGTGGLSTSSYYAMRGQIRATMASLPSGITAARIYEVEGPASPSTPTLTNMKRQSPTNTSNSPTAHTVYLRTYDSAGAAYFASNTFPAGTSVIQGDDGAAVTANWLIGGAGDFRIPLMSKAQRDAFGAQAGDLAADSLSGSGYLYDGTDWAAISHVGRVLARTAWVYSDLTSGGPSAVGIDGGSAQSQFDASTEGVYFVNSNTQASWSAQSIAGHPGVAEGETGNTATGAASMRARAAIWDPVAYSSLRCGFLIRLPTLSATAQRYRIVAGFCSESQANTSTDPNSWGTTENYACLLYSENINSGNWRAQVGDQLAGSPSTADTGVAVVANTWYFLEVVLASAVARFYINGSLVATISTHVPNAVMGHLCKINKIVGTSTRTVDIDMYYVQGDFLANRYG